ncbi:hypothetical protein PIB30_061759 [Stylosanthes scabra]|uniref:Uncharacterized protein n=1 Tax=Stylosanthes scabra TaxID=79078 RepID=A0ABU6WJ82_9FABA|nr:hypothetical protein [Stylosanthes scabra]
MATDRTLADNSNRDLSSNSSRGWREYVRTVRRRVFEMSSSLHAVLLVFCLLILYRLVKIISTKEFDFPHGDKPLLKFGEALDVFFDEMLITSAFSVFSFLTWLLVSPVQLELQFSALIILLYGNLYYFAVLIRACSGVYVDLEGFKLPLVLFCTVGALGIAWLCVLFTLLMGYIGWRKAGGREKTINIRLGDLVPFIPH